MNKPPSLFNIILRVLSISNKHSWFYAYIPWMFCALCLIPGFVVWKLGLNETVNIDKQSVVMCISAFLVVGGVLGAACIASMTQVQQVCSAWPFSSYLREIDLLEEFSAMPQIIFFIQIVCIIIMSISVSLAFFIKNNLILLIFNTGLVVYLSVKTFGLLSLIRKLNWHYSTYMIKYNES